VACDQEAAAGGSEIVCLFALNVEAKRPGRTAYATFRAHQSKDISAEAAATDSATQLTSLKTLNQFKIFMDWH